MSSYPGPAYSDSKEPPLTKSFILTSNSAGKVEVEYAHLLRD